MATASADDRCCPAAFSSNGDDISVTTVENLSADIMAQVLRCLNDASLTAVGCACAALDNLAADPDACLALCPPRT
jgi:hypothetical protein